MAFLNFPETLYVKTIDTSEIIRLGSLSPNEILELAHIRVFLYIAGTMNGTEQIRLNICSDSDCTKTIFSSSWSALTGLPVGGNFLGWVRTDFAREGLNPNITYHIGLELTGYTRNADTFYISGVFDFPAPVYIATGGNVLLDHNIGMQVFGYKELE